MINGQKGHLAPFVVRTGKIFTLSVLGNFAIGFLGWVVSFFVIQSYAAKRTHAFVGINQEPNTFFFGLLVPFACTGILMILFSRKLSTTVNNRNENDGAFVWAGFIPIAISLLFGMCVLMIAAFD